MPIWNFPNMSIELNGHNLAVYFFRFAENQKYYDNTISTTVEYPRLV
jgi:hypothetical protein